jgi:hypothetical protein
VKERGIVYPSLYREHKVSDSLLLQLQISGINKLETKRFEQFSDKKKQRFEQKIQIDPINPIIKRSKMK